MCTASNPNPKTKKRSPNKPNKHQQTQNRHQHFIRPSREYTTSTATPSTKSPTPFSCSLDLFRNSDEPFFPPGRFLLTHPGHRSFPQQQQKRKRGALLSPRIVPPFYPQKKVDADCFKGGHAFSIFFFRKVMTFFLLNVLQKILVCASPKKCP